MVDDTGCFITKLIDQNCANSARNNDFNGSPGQCWFSHRMPSTNKAVCGKAQQQQHAIAGHEWQGNHNFFFLTTGILFKIKLRLLCLLIGEKQLPAHASCCCSHSYCCQCQELENQMFKAFES